MYSLFKRMQLAYTEQILTVSEYTLTAFFNIPKTKVKQHAGRRNNAPVMLPQEMLLKRPFAIYESTRQSRVIDIYLSDAIIEPLEYTDVIHTIKTASEGDIIYLHINCPGGQIDTGIQLVNALSSTPAHVVTELEGVGHSMAALMFLCGDELVVHENTQLMFHTYSGGVIGKGSDIRGQTDATESWFRSIAYDICYPFMTKREIVRMLRGEDFWFQYADIQPRIEKMVEVMQKEADEQKAVNDLKTQADFDRIIREALEEKAEIAESEEARNRYMAAAMCLSGEAFDELDAEEEQEQEFTVIHHDEDEPEGLFEQLADAVKTAEDAGLPGAEYVMQPLDTNMLQSKTKKRGKQEQ